MTTLVISAPWYKKDEAGNNISKSGQSHSWETYFNTRIGLGYILYPAEINKLQQGISSGYCKIVILRNDKKPRRAEARLIKLKITPRQARNGQWRYDVYFEEPKEITPYVYLPYEKLKENGVKVI